MLKEEFEILRGTPIQLKADAADVPCMETSDPTKLCRHPLVSIRMITYNHEKFIREAVESVMAQETDFEYELIIGEDASPDNTREICFELQKKYPDRIRVLWSEKNLGDVNKNSVRVLSRCRGEFHALLEGDDYWTDNHKLQKQVDVMRIHPEVSFCFGEKQDYMQEKGKFVSAHVVARSYPEGVIAGSDFLETNCLVPPFTVLYRASALTAMYERFEIFNWSLRLGDLQLWRGLAHFGDVYVSHDLFATYRVHAGGVMHQIPTGVSIDAGIVRMFFARAAEDTPSRLFLEGMESLIYNRCYDIQRVKGYSQRRRALRELRDNPVTGVPLLQYIGAVGCLWVSLGLDLRFLRRLRKGIAHRLSALI